MNVSKCKIVTYSSRTQPIIYNYRLENTLLTRSVTVKDLGVYFDSKLSFLEHRNHAISAATKTLGFIIRNSTSFQTSTIMCLYNTYVRPRIEYASIIWNPFYNTHKLAIEKVQRKYLKYLFFKDVGVYPPRGIEYNVLVDKFNAESLEARRRLTSLKFLYNLVHFNIDSPELLSQLNFLIPRLGSRQCATFYSYPARTNTTLNSPLALMCRHFNAISPYCDINNSSLVQILSTARTHQG